MATAPVSVGPQTIFLKPSSSGMSRHYEEGRCGATAITPGMLIEHDAVATYKGDDSNATYKPHATATGVAAPAIAIEAVFGGYPDGGVGKGGTIDDNYVTGDVVRFIYASSGDVIWGWLATGNDASAPGAKLASNGDGTFRVSTTNAMFEAVDYLNNTSGSKQRLRMRKL